MTVGLEERIAQLSRVTDWWLTESAARSTALQALRVSTGYSVSHVSAALNAVFQELTPEKLRAYCAENDALLQDKESAKIVLHIVAGTVFTSWLHGAVITLLLGLRCWIKPSATEPVFANLWKASLDATAPRIANRMAVVLWDGALSRKVDAVVAYGSDDTLAGLRAHFAGKPFIGYGHKWSFGIIFQEALETDEWPRWRDGVLLDSCVFDRQGCLSPQALYLQSRRERLPDGLPIPAGPVLRRFSTLDEILSNVLPRRHQLSCIGIAGHQTREAEVKTHFGSPDKIRYCRLGDMQRPSLSWRNGGIALPEELVRQPSLGLAP